MSECAEIQRNPEVTHVSLIWARIDRVCPPKYPGHVSPLALIAFRFAHGFLAAREDELEIMERALRPWLLTAVKAKGLSEFLR